MADVILLFTCNVVIEHKFAAGQLQTSKAGLETEVCNIQNFYITIVMIFNIVH